MFGHKAIGVRLLDYSVNATAVCPGKPKLHATRFPAVPLGRTRNNGRLRPKQLGGEP